MARKLTIRIEKSIIQAEKLGLFKTSARDIVLNSQHKKDLELFDDPVFSKERFFIVRGLAGELECCGEEMLEEWNYCPHCGNSIDQERIYQVFRSIEKAREHEFAIELGIDDVYVIMVQEKAEMGKGEKQWM